MISREEIKQKLLTSDMFIDNYSLDQYVELMFKNINTPVQKDVTQKHHILPKHYYLHRNLKIDNSKENLINLPIYDHIRAHYYLYKCSKDTNEKYSNLYALRKMLGGKFSSINSIETLDNEECLNLYKDYIEGNRQAHLGKTHTTSDETKRKIGLANSGKYQNYVTVHDKEGNERRIPKNELVYYLDDGWIKGRSEKSIQGLKKGYNYNSKGMLGKNQSDFQKEQVRKALLGKEKSQQAKDNMAKSKLGKKLYVNPETGKGKYIDSKEIEEYKKLGWYQKKRNN